MGLCQSQISAPSFVPFAFCLTAMARRTCSVNVGDLINVVREFVGMAQSKNDCEHYFL